MKSKNKGFTLAGLLIVVAIIGVLVAISIPIFTNLLEKSRESTDLANIRSEYAVIMADAISGTYDPDEVYAVSLKQSSDGWQSFETNEQNPLFSLFDTIQGAPKSKGVATLHFNKPDEGKITLVFDGLPTGFVSGALTMKDAIKNYYKTASGSMSSWDSNYGTSHSGLNAVRDKLGADLKDVKAWAVINSKHGTSDNKFSSSTAANNKDEAYFKEAEKDLYYLWTGVDISGNSMVGKKVPVMVSYTDNEGREVYSVTDITVTNGDGSYYNVISGKNPRPSGSGYNIDTHLGANGTRQDFATDYYAAYAEYQKRLSEYNSGN